MDILDDDQNNHYMSLGRELGFDAAVSEALDFHLQTLVAYVVKYPWLWKYGDGRGGAVFEQLESYFLKVGFSRAYPDYGTTNRPKRKPIKKSDIIATMQASGGMCVACGSEEDLEIDHIQPVSRGGTNERDNLQMLCKTCNMSKGSKTMDEWMGGAE